MGVQAAASGGQGQLVGLEVDDQVLLAEEGGAQNERASAFVHAEAQEVVAVVEIFARKPSNLLACESEENRRE